MGVRECCKESVEDDEWVEWWWRGGWEWGCVFGWAWLWDGWMLVGSLLFPLFVPNRLITPVRPLFVTLSWWRGG